LYFLVSVPNEAFHKVMSLRALQRRLGIDTSVYRNATDLLRNVERSFGGRLVLLDWSNGWIAADLPVPGASGIAVRDGCVLASSWTDHSVLMWQPGYPLSSISHPWFNHLHTVELTASGTMMIASAGIDAILEVSAQGEVLSHWCGGAAVPELGKDYRGVRRSTAERTMHITSALPVGDDKILAALFHQGEVRLIDRPTGESQTILSGLTHPHGIHRLPGGYIVSDTLGHRILFLDDAFRLCSEIPFGSEWLQDTIGTSAGTYLVLENVHIDQRPEPGLSNAIVEIDRSGRPLRRLTMPADYRLFAAREIGENLARSMVEGWTGAGGLDQWVWE
jgi:hypothetical protein